MANAAHPHAIRVKSPSAVVMAARTKLTRVASGPDSRKVGTQIPPRRLPFWWPLSRHKPISLTCLTQSTLTLAISRYPGGRSHRRSFRGADQPPTTAAKADFCDCSAEPCARIPRKSYCGPLLHPRRTRCYHILKLDSRAIYAGDQDLP